MTVSVTHAQQLSITTSTSNPVMPLTMLQQTSTGTTTSTTLTSSSSNGQHCTNNESNYTLLHNNINSKVYHTPAPSATTTTSSFIVTSSAKATRVLAPPLVATTTTTITATTNTTTSPPSSSTSSSSTTALRRLYFKTGRNAAKTRQTSSVPKVVVMGSSSTSEATINTSTESASTLVTNITATTDTDTTADSLDLGDTSGQSDPLLSSSLDDNPLTSITSESDSLEKDEIQSIVTVAEGNGFGKNHDNDSASSQLINYEDIPLHPYKTPQTAPLATSARFQFDPPQSPKSVRTFSEKHQTHFTFDDLKFKLKGKSSPHTSNSSSENLKLNRLRSHKSKKPQHDLGDIDADDDDDDVRGARIMSAYRGEKVVKNSTMFPFDREALDYERIQRECFACEDESSNGDTNMYYDGGGKASQKHLDDRNYYSDDIRSPSEIFYQYTLLSQEEYQEKTSPHSRRSQKYHNKSYRKSKNRGAERYELDHYNTIPSPRAIVSPPLPPGSQQVNQPSGGQPSNTPPLPDLRIDYFAELTNNIKMNNTNTSTSSSTSSSQHDDLLATGQKYTSNNCSANSNGGGGPINVTPNPMDTAVYTQPRATIVVQQASLSLDNSVETYLLKNEGDFISVEQGKELRKKKQREENMRQLLDVTNTFTSEEIRDFEMRYGSPHHSRSQSVKTPGSRASGRPNQLSLPQQRSRVASMPNTGVEEEYYRLRHFSITGKGVINRGDSLKSRRSRSNNSVASSNSSTEHLTAIPAQPSQNVSASGSVKTSAACSLASSRESSTSNPAPSPYKVLMLGGAAVGKSSLVSQFMTSEYLHAYDTSIDDDTGEKSVSVLLSGEESELIFIDHPHNEMMPENCIATYDPHGYCVIYSSADKSSFGLAEKILQTLWTSENIAQKAVILVGNKADLARSRVITPEEGKSMATAYDCKFIETSVGINHNVDELLVGILSQIRLKLENPEKSRDLFRKRSTRKSKRRACSPLGTAAACLSGNGGTNTSTPVSNIAFNDFSTPPGSAHSSPRKYRGSRTSASLKVKGLLGRVWARDSKSKSCENLHVL